MSANFFEKADTFGKIYIICTWTILDLIAISCIVLGTLSGYPLYQHSHVMGILHMGWGFTSCLIVTILLNYVLKIGFEWASD